MTGAAILCGYPADSVGGRAILRGRADFDAGRPMPCGWPYLAQRGWFQRKAEREAARRALLRALWARHGPDGRELPPD